LFVGFSTAGPRLYPNTHITLRRYPVPCDKGTVLLPLNKFSKSDPSPGAGLYYSWQVPGTAHFISLTSYITNDTFSEDTAQYKWFEKDLKSVDRNSTPWLIVYFHAPLVTSFEDSFKQAECMRLTYEPLLFKYGVDLVLNGHVHAYERTRRVYNYTLDPCGPMHITIGSGGKPGIETGEYALDTSYIDVPPIPAWCQDPSLLDKRPNPTQPLRCTTYQPKLGGFCWNKQPDFSAYRESAYGHGTLILINATHAEWKWCVYSWVWGGEGGSGGWLWHQPGGGRVGGRGRESGWGGGEGGGGAPIAHNHTHAQEPQQG